jgi:hypothetical protein
VREIWLHWQHFTSQGKSIINNTLRQLEKIIEFAEETSNSLSEITIRHKSKPSEYFHDYKASSDFSDLEVCVFLLKELLEDIQDYYIEKDPSQKFVRGAHFIYKGFGFNDSFGLTEEAWDDVSIALEQSLKDFPSFMKQKHAHFQLVKFNPKIVSFNAEMKTIKIGMHNALKMSKYLPRIFTRGLLYQFWELEFHNREEWIKESGLDQEQYINLLMRMIYGGFYTPETQKLLKYIKNRPKYELEKSANLDKAIEAIKNLKVAVRLSELLNAKSEIATKYAKPVTLKLMKAAPKIGRWMFKAYGNKKGSSEQGHVVKLAFKKVGKTKDVQKLQMKVSCSCDAFKYWGISYNLSSLNSSLEHEDRPPDIRDPEGKNFMCKHIYTALNFLKDHKYKVS